ncbi:MAG: Pdz/Dhr/GlgF [Helicobacteraceae bacterium CG2_30_36_10]|nr:MAG: Pdz/Dhr/GlgF [Helicobacteraceae bacterium CG2_30_36_10]
MLKLFLALSFVLFNLQASCEGGYDSCKQKIIDSNSIVNQTLQIPVNNNKRVIFSLKTPHAKILKHDPFLSLYLVEEKSGFKYPFRINNHLSLGQASVDKTTAIEGKIVKNQIGLNSFATFSEPLHSPALLTNSCCGLEGIVTPRGIIEKEYIQRFLTTKDTEYADIGIRVQDEKNLVVVAAVDPFMKNNPFKKDDCILFLDGKKIYNSASLMREILFAKVGSAHIVKIKRGSEILDIKITSKKLYSGGYKSDTFLEQFGWLFDKDLNIIKIDNRVNNYALKLGDKLMQVNGKSIKNKQDIIDNISDFEDYASLLFEREHFQFFVQIN